MLKILMTDSVFLLVLSTSVFAAPQTMRLDYYHTGDAKQEVFSLDRVLVEPLPWPGDLGKTRDTTNLGKYFFEVRDQKTKEPLAPFGGTSDEMRRLSQIFRDKGLYTFTRWHSFFANPPLCITEAELREGFGILDAALAELEGSSFST